VSLGPAVSGRQPPVPPGTSEAEGAQGAQAGGPLYE